jgi:hypothetical protein
MDTARLEAFLARIYTDPAALQRFLAAPIETARQAGLSSDQAQALAAWDHVGARMAAAGFGTKRVRLTASSHDVDFRGRLRRWWRWQVLVPLRLAAWRLRRRVRALPHHFLR